MRRCLTAAAVFAFAALFVPPSAFAAAAPFDHLAWRSIGPAVAGGRVPAVAGTAANPNLYYIGAAGGGVWKTDNGGATWSAVFAHEPVSAIGAVTIDPTNENVVWVGTGEANPRNDVSYGDGVYKTTDGGKTWRNLGLKATRHISRILVDPKDPNHVLVGAFGDPYRDSRHRGVYVTNDGGKTWTKSLYVGPQTGAAELAMDPNNPQIVYASMWQFRRLPWTFHSGGPQDGIWRSEDGGKTWTRLAGHGLPTGLTGRSAVAIAPSNSKRVYAIIEAKHGILWRSDDGGQNWKMVSDNTLVDQRPFYFTHLNVDPKNENHVYAVSMELAESTDGGMKFHPAAKGVHVDFHAMWIAPNDPNRMIVGEDGGYAITLDGGKNWAFSRNIPIGQVYHVGVSIHENPYWVCGALQDNNGFCAPENSKNSEGILNGNWQNVIGGDGMWAVPDPADPQHILTDLQTGIIFDYDRVTQTGRMVKAYQDFSRNDFDQYRAKYRFNWDAPIAFAPWDGRTLWLGGNVVFQSHDNGVHWKAISPDLTRNIKAHQQPSGGPITLDVSSAENSDNLLYIEGSPVKRGMIWTGADDGVIGVTTDGGKQWNKYMPAGVPPYGRVETVSASPFDPATAYATIDRHRSGDYKPYLLVTHDYGKHWAERINGLPSDQYVRTVRADARNRNLLFAGTENGIWISYDAGAHWSAFNMNLPTVSVRDIREQPQFDDLVIATHGRALWILDDIASLQQLPQAQRQRSMLFKPQAAYEYTYHSNDEGLYTRFAGQNPPDGAIIDFYQDKPQTKAPEIEILDARGRVIRHIAPAKPKKKGAAADADFRGPTAGPGVSNFAGINRVVWNFREDGVPMCDVCAPMFRGAPVGVVVPPGRYTARVVLNGHSYAQPFDVRSDPHSPYSKSDMLAAYRFAKKYEIVGGRIDTVLNQLGKQEKSLTAAQTALAKAHDAALSASVAHALAMRQAMFDTFTANYQNGEDSIQRPGKLREDVPRSGFGAPAPPTPATLAYARRFDAEYNAAMAKYQAYLTGTFDPLMAKLKAAHIP